MISKRFSAVMAIISSPLNGFKKVKKGSEKASIEIQTRNLLAKSRKHIRETQRLIFAKIDDGVFISPTRKSLDIKSLEAINFEVRIVKKEEARIRQDLEVLPSDLSEIEILRKLNQLKVEANTCYLQIHSIVDKVKDL